jgi:hypothetical protein
MTRESTRQTGEAMIGGLHPNTCPLEAVLDVFRTKWSLEETFGLIPRNYRLPAGDG